MRQCLRLGIWFQKFLAGGLVSWGIFSQMCFPLVANALQISIPYKNSSIIYKSADVGVRTEVPKVGDRGLGGISIPEQILTLPYRRSAVPSVPHSPRMYGRGDSAPTYALLPLNSDELTQQNSVSELSDVKPTDWAYQALRSLTVRYGVSFGYLDNSFHGKPSAVPL